MLICVLGLLSAAASARADDYTAVVNPASVISTNFEGWGSSLCWWANVIGGWSNRDDYVNRAFSELKLNIVRYNIGGGENPALTNTITNYRAIMQGFEPTNGVWDWTADANQRWVLQAAIARGVDRVVAFANSPPWWMTVSGSVTGAVGGTNNLAVSHEHDFAVYLATVVSNLTVLDGVHFDYVTPMNEPLGGWTYNNQKQEGCHMSADQQARVVDDLRAELDAQGQSCGIDAPESYSEDNGMSSLNDYPPAALGDVALVATHTYGHGNPGGIRGIASALGRPLWVSEYGESDGSGLTMARRIRDDITDMGARAWIYWQVVDGASGWGFLHSVLKPNADGSFDTSYTINKKFYVMAQFSKFIRPGCDIISVGDANTLAAYNPTNHTLVLVLVNTDSAGFNVTYDLSAFRSLPGQVIVYQTAPGENLALLPNLPVSGGRFTSSVPGQSVTTFVLTNVTLALRIISDLPPQATVLPGTRFTYSVQTVGDPPVGYQWRHNSMPIAGQTNSTYSLTAGSLGSGTYSVLITNAYGAAVSTVSTLTVAAPPTNLYAQAILSLNPTAYWPMHESAAPAPGDVETNRGTLGADGTAFYADWDVNGGTPGNASITRQVPGALGGDPDTAARFSGKSTAYLIVPHTSPLTTLQPPFTIECWARPADLNFDDIISQDGTVNLNSATGRSGIRLIWAGSNTAGPNFQVYVGTGSGDKSFVSPTAHSLNQWYYLALTYNGSSVNLYVNGTAEIANEAVVMVPNTWWPLTIGNGLWTRAGTGATPQRPFSGDIDEVAVYTNALPASVITAHYAVGVGGGAGAYETTVLAGHPLLYYRMNSPLYDKPLNSAWPAMVNYGSVATAGVYHPGMAAGSVTGPNAPGPFPSNLGNANAAAGNGLSSYADGGFDPAYNAAGPFSLTVWFRSNPADPRWQSICGHGVTSWQVAMTPYGFIRFNPGASAVANGIGDLTSSHSYNDGLWHQIVVTHDGTANTLYMDGALDKTTTDIHAVNGLGSSQHVLIGADPSFLDSPFGPGRQFAGNLCEVAFFNGQVLNARQVQSLYAAAVAPGIRMDRQGNNLQITFTGTLLSSTNASGPYEPVAGATSPFSIPPTNGQMFYRASQP